MRFVFTRLFYLLLVVGFIPLSLAWGRPWLRWVTLGYDLLILLAAYVDARISLLPSSVRIAREFSGRFAVGAETEVHVKVANATPRPLSLILKDEFPPQMAISGLREGKMRVPAQSSAALVYGLKPPKRGVFEFGSIAVRYLSRFGL